MSTCRFCGRREFAGGRLIKYSLRHYAHPACYLDAGKPLADLSAWQIEQFPYRLIIERGLLPTVERIMADKAEHDARRQQRRDFERLRKVED